MEVNEAKRGARGGRYKEIEQTQRNTTQHQPAFERRMER
jgi:hypothetical protein